MTTLAKNLGHLKLINFRTEEVKILAKLSGPCPHYPRHRSLICISKINMGIF